MKSSFRTRFYYDWVLYVAVVVVAVVVWYLAFGLFNAPAPTETIDVFFAGTVKDYSIAEQGQKAMETSGVKLVEIISCSPSDEVFSTKYSVVGVNACDVVVVPVSVADKTDCKNTFLKLEGFSDTYLQEGEAYGVILSETTRSALSAYFDFGAEDYVVFVVASSKNAVGDALAGNATAFLRWLVSYEG